MKFMTRRCFTLILVSVVLAATLCSPINNAFAKVQNISVTRLIDEQSYKKTLFVIATSEKTYHILVSANITTVGNETIIDLSATLFNPHNGTITASARIPDTLTDAPYYSGSVEAFRLHLPSLAVTLLKLALPVVIVVALVLQVINIIEDYIEHTVLEALKAVLFGGPFIYVSLPWILLTLLLHDTNQDGSFDLYVPYWPPIPHIGLVLHRHYFVATSLSWWEIEEREVYIDVPIPFDGVWHIVLFTYAIAEWNRTRVISAPKPTSPTAEFIWNPNVPIENETVTFISTSFAPNGTIVTYQWWMGDGGQEAVNMFQYVYSTAGNYNVTLKVTDNNGLTANVTHAIRVDPTTMAALRVIPDRLDVSVQAGQSATAEFLVGETLNHTDLLGITPKAYDMSNIFENQTISSGNITFNKNGITVAKGTYTNITASFHAPKESQTGWYNGNITLSSENGGNATIFVNLYVSSPPHANFTWEPLMPKTGETTTFNASSSTPNGGVIQWYNWDFDSGKSNVSNPIVTHSFSSPGTYNVTLTVGDSEGFTDTTWQLVTVVSAVIHDISIINVTTSASHAYPGRVVNITVMVKNNGEASETLNVTTYRDSIPIGTQLVTNLTIGGNTTLIFDWDTSGLTPCHNWTIRAEAPLIGDINPLDNNVTDGTVKIKMIGDVNADGVIDGQDIVTIVEAIPSYPGHPWWNPEADLDNDGVVDGVDLVTVLINLGLTCS